MAKDQQPKTTPGEVSEWLKEHAWKACVRQKCTANLTLPSSVFPVIPQYLFPALMLEAIFLIQGLNIGLNMATIKIVYRNRKLSNGNYPVFLRIAHLKAQAFYIRLKGFQFTRIEQFDKSLGRFTPKQPKYKQLNELLTAIETRSDDIAASLEVRGQFTYDSFKRKYLGKGENDDIFKAYDDKIISLRKLGKEGTALAYEASKKAISKYSKNSHIKFSDISYSFLKGFEEKKRIEGSGGTNISYLLRPLRALHYDYCNRMDIPQHIVYKKFNIQRLTTKTISRALTKEEFKRLLDYSPVTKLEELAQDIFMFSFYTRGMNINDIAGLTINSISGNNIYYRRSKTSSLFTIHISHNIQLLIEKYSSKKEHLFPIVREGLSFKKSVTTFNLKVNKQLKRIAKKIYIPETISMYWARHSWATLAQQNGVSVDKISEGLGHSDLKTTQIYLAGFSSAEIDEVTYNIINSL